MITPPIVPIFFGLQGLALTEEERAFFSQAQPLGFILFKRNLESKEQIVALVNDLKSTANHHDPLILIDQEGGRVQRLREPMAPLYPANLPFDAFFHHDSEKAKRAVYLKHLLMGIELAALGIHVNCVPVLDQYVEGADGIIGDRAFSSDPYTITALAGECLRGCYDAGIMPIIKHIPTHGPANADSHKALPIVSLSQEELEPHFYPFKAHAQAPWAMTAHIIYQAFDEELPATLSSKVIQQVIRHHIGFDGFLLSDDLTMKALEPLTLIERGQKALQAGCDALIHWNGELEEMTALVDHLPPITADSWQRYQQSLAFIQNPLSLDQQAARQELNSLLEEMTAHA